jgi:5-methylcytosine-specific restriction endonuclease McrA
MSGAVYSTPRWRTVRAYVLRRDSHRCQIQGPRCTSVATTVDHIRELHAGGAAYDPANLRAACLHCNSSRGASYGNATRTPHTVQW